MKLKLDIPKCWMDCMYCTYTTSTKGKCKGCHEGNDYKNYEQTTPTIGGIAEVK